jgi:hypothetical protein
VIAVVVAVAFTVCVTFADVLPMKLVSPAYTAESVSVPAAGKVIEQVPAATVPVQVSPTPSLTVTLPVGVPLPGEFAVTVKLILTAWPTSDGLGVCAVIVVDVLSWFTVCDPPPEVPPLKLASPT